LWIQRINAGTRELGLTLKGRHRSGPQGSLRSRDS
jgi:hypothetical protein